MNNSKSTMTIYIEDSLKKRAKVNALMQDLTLREYLINLILEDDKRRCKNGK